MKIKDFLAALFTGIILFIDPGISLANPRSVDLDTPFKIQFGEKVQIKSEEMTITFKTTRVTRCPAGARCLVADNVSIYLEINKTTESAIKIRFNNMRGSKSALAYQNYKIEFLKLEPALPRSPTPYKEKDFVVSLNVSKAPQ